MERIELTDAERRLIGHHAEDVGGEWSVVYADLSDDDIFAIEAAMRRALLRYDGGLKLHYVTRLGEASFRPAPTTADAHVALQLALLAAECPAGRDARAFSAIVQLARDDIGHAMKKLATAMANLPAKPVPVPHG